MVPRHYYIISWLVKHNQDITGMASAQEWLDHLKGVTVNTLPTDFMRQNDSKRSESKCSSKLASATLQALESLADKYQTNQYNIAVSAWIILVYRICGDDSVTVGSQVVDTGTHSVVHCNFDIETKFDDVLQSVIRANDFAKKNPVDHSVIIESAGKELFQSLFVPKCEISVSHKDLTFFFGSDHKIDVIFNSLLFKEERIHILIAQIELILQECALRENVAVSRISLISLEQKNILPDPTADLDWCNFKGAIHEIFTKNALAFPDRPCVVETANICKPHSILRSFSYRQINESSNIVAHYLIKCGIKNDDVITIYAYRGVDFVIAVMGALKAGATFSTLDPQYPAERQRVFLNVAKPKGVIYLKKAGQISSEVTALINDMQIDVQLQALEMQDDGSLSSKNDVLKQFSHLGSTQPDVIVGPDSRPTLSFTSGSEGVPKGVCGRHFSLTYYFPWMAETFDLSENDRFTMLSGIAHDPVQRDIFTPLFLGAQLFVPSADDIGTPGRLAEWMAENHVTVTHLTPAMGQLLSAGATAMIPSLKNAFFVGDILTKRDCLKLQNLARNVSIVNMYGTTETQRAVSYFRIPSVTVAPRFLETQKDLIPAGKGMLNVQILVVNRHDPSQICGIGELGEIYVRAGGLSNGYLRLPDMTSEKFLTNWFVPINYWVDKVPVDAPWRKYWLGPRDRMYKTGDLGRYLPNGDCECSGRVDNQVKIRGFRIELGEIDTHLSRHPHVRENVTLLRRAKGEDPMLVSYIVPDLTARDLSIMTDEKVKAEDDKLVVGFVSYKQVLRGIREYLKSKLPVYAVPQLIVPLEVMPLNPNGKIDKQILPYPNAEQMSRVREFTKNETDHWTATEKKVCHFWKSILPEMPANIEPTDSFFDLGGHSVLATKMIFEARNVFGLPQLPLGAIFAAPSIREFANLMSTGIYKSTIIEKLPNVTSYAEDAEMLASSLPNYLLPANPIDQMQHLTVFVTGVTGFLGTFILRELLSRENIDVIAHVRANSSSSGFERVCKTAKAYGTWDEAFEKRIEVVTGNLEDVHFGLVDKEWEKLCLSIDVVIHNGAHVNWVYPYETLRGANVVSTINVMSLCAQGKPKYFTFVSSTSVLDSEHYLQLSDRLIEIGSQGVPESDNLEGSRTGLSSGYGQSKWAAEYLVRYSGTHKSLAGYIVRPGYIVGDSETGVSNIDDFLLRMLKGCQQLGIYPKISSHVNMVPVDHVARLTVACALHGNPNAGIRVAHVTSHPRVSFEDLFIWLISIGYTLRSVDYKKWCAALESHASESEENALFPLMHFVLDDLPQSMRAAELDDTNTKDVLIQDSRWTGVDASAGRGVDEKLLTTFVSFLVACGFLEPPKNGSLPHAQVSAEMLCNFTNAGGRAQLGLKKHTN